jgi:dCMP deaminase
MPNKWTAAYMDVAERFAALSYCERLKVGAIVVKDGRIISIGYNGTPSGFDNCCEMEVVDTSYRVPQMVKKTKPEVIHAEANAIAKLAKSTDSGDGADMYCTHAPCIECAKQIYTAGIKNLTFREEYRSKDGITFLEQCGVNVNKYR